MAADEAAACSLFRSTLICCIWLKGIHDDVDNSNAFKLVWCSPENVFVAGPGADEYPFCNKSNFKFFNTKEEVLLNVVPRFLPYIQNKLERLGF